MKGHKSLSSGDKIKEYIFELLIPTLSCDIRPGCPVADDNIV
jgi:hypothetical protein